MQPVHVSEIFGGLAQGAASEDAPGDDTQARPQIHAKGLDEHPDAARLQYSAPSEDGAVEVREEVRERQLLADELAGTPRNAPCPCGSGKKFKMCHGKDA
ncbi:SEC-C metal-binding domain-containing protein [Actinomycetota bacterium]